MKFTAKNIRVYLNDEKLNIDVSMIAECPIKMINVPITITRSNKMEYKKDYSLLRPFDLEAAKRGDDVADRDGSKVKFITTNSRGDVAFVERNDGSATTWMTLNLRMSPLAWVEGRPVYKFDNLWHTGRNCMVTVIDRNCRNENICEFPGHISPLFANDEYLTWTKLKQKREGWVNIVPISKSGACGEIKDKIVRNGDIFDDYDTARKWAERCGDVVATVAISWEE